MKVRLLPGLSSSHSSMVEHLAVDQGIPSSSLGAGTTALWRNGSVPLSDSGGEGSIPSRAINYVFVTNSDSPDSFRTGRDC